MIITEDHRELRRRTVHERVPDGYCSSASGPGQKMMTIKPSVGSGWPAPISTSIVGFIARRFTLSQRCQSSMVLQAGSLRWACGSR